MATFDDTAERRSVEVFSTLVEKNDRLANSKKVSTMIYDKAKIKHLRLGRGWSQHELARRAGVSQPTVFSVERGSPSVRATTLQAIAKALDVPLRSIMPNRLTTKDEQMLVEDVVAIFDSLPNDLRAAWIAAGKALQRPNGHKK